jgi:hypothetical protein
MHTFAPILPCMQKLLQLFKIKFIQIFTHGLSPVQLATTLSFGITLGIFPFIGLTSILCFAFAFIFRLNVVVIQLVNWLVAPLQLILLVPFYQLGNYLNITLYGSFFKTMGKTVSTSQNYIHSFLLLLDSQLFAIIGWTTICIPIAFLIHFISLYFYKKHLLKKAI